MKVRITKSKKRQRITCAIVNRRVHAGFSVFAFNYFSCDLTAECFAIRTKNMLPYIVHHMSTLLLQTKEN